MFTGSPADGCTCFPGCFMVPRWYTTNQSFVAVPGPDPVSSTWLPAIIRWSGSLGSTANGFENCAVSALIPGGSMAAQVLPPSVVPLIAPYTYSPYALSEFRGSTPTQKPS